MTVKSFRRLGDSSRAAVRPSEHSSPFSIDLRYPALPRASYQSACLVAGLPGRIPHDFRRTAVRNLERAGVPRSVAMELVGHKTESAYQRYDIVAERDLTDGVAR
jgi:integrase